jgi:hypothetical protein
VETAQSNDHFGYLQRALSQIAPEQWASPPCFYSVPSVIAVLFLPALDGELIGELCANEQGARPAAQTKEFSEVIAALNDKPETRHEGRESSFNVELASTTLGAILDGCLGLRALVSAGVLATASEMVDQIIDDGQELSMIDVQTHFILAKSSFGQYLLRRFASKVRKKATTAAAVLSMIKKWQALPPAEQAGYRWETLSQEERNELEAVRGASLSPQSKAAVRLAGKHDNHLRTAAAVAIPTCAQCGKEGNSTVSLRACGKCLVVLYCSTQCQAQSWPQHSKECRALRRQQCHSTLD